jgi:hypothetical protein
MLQRARVDGLLTNLSVKYANGIYVAERCYPALPVDAQSDKYPVYGRQNFVAVDDQRSPGGLAREASWSWSEDTYFCDGHALKDYVPRERQNEQNPSFDLMQDVTAYLTDRILLNQEINLVAKLAATLTGTSLAAQTSTHWDAASGGISSYDPVAIIRAQADVIGKRIGMMPNRFTVSQPVWTAIRNNTNVKSLISGGATVGDPADITPAAFARLIDVNEVNIGRAVKNTANEGQATETMDWVWGETACLYYCPPVPGRRTVALGYTFNWRGALRGIAGVSEDGSQFVKRYYWEPNTADVVEVHKYYDQKTVSVLAGVLFTDCLT